MFRRDFYNGVVAKKRNDSQSKVFLNFGKGTLIEENEGPEPGGRLITGAEYGIFHPFFFG